MMNRAMHLADRLIGKTCLLEMPVHIAGKHKSPIRQTRRNLPQDAETAMWNHFPIQLQPVAVKPPGKAGITHKRPWVGHFLEMQPRLPQRRICAPKSLGTPKIRQTRIYTHARTSSNEQAGSLGDLSGTAEEK